MSWRRLDSSQAWRSSGRALPASPAAIKSWACCSLPSQGLGRYLSSISRTWVSGWAPTNPSTGWPSLMTITVGRLRTPSCWAIICCSSALTLASRKSPAYSLASSFQQRHQHLAGLAPVRPEIHHHGPGAGFLDQHLLRVGLVDVDDEFAHGFSLNLSLGRMNSTPPS